MSPMAGAETAISASSESSSPTALARGAASEEVVEALLFPGELVL